MKKGDIVLIPFPFTNLSGKKLRPALVLAVSPADIIVAFITTQTAWKEPADIEIESDPNTGIKKASLIRPGKLATLDKTIAIGRIGTLPVHLINQVNISLKAILQLG
jgi:mRNA interferase MazF